MLKIKVVFQVPEGNYCHSFNGGVKREYCIYYDWYGVRCFVPWKKDRTNLFTKLKRAGNWTAWKCAACKNAEIKDE
jgi:hypothetical protein